MRNFKSGGTALLIAVVLLLPQIALSQCGNFNGDAATNILDIVDLNSYLFAGEAAPSDYDHADFDLHVKLTVNDLMHLVACMPICDFYDVQCPPTEAAIDPLVDPDFHIVYPGAVPVNMTTFEIVIATDGPVKSQAICLPLRLRIDGVVPQIDSIKTATGSSYAEGSGSSAVRYNAVLDSDSGIVITTGTKMSTPFSGFDPDPIATIFVTVPAQAYPQVIDLQYVELTPEQAVAGQENSIFAMYLPPNFLNNADLPKEPVLTPNCCIVPGDVNGDGKTTITDAVGIICIIFGECSLEGRCAQTLDLDGSGSLSISDAVYLVNYIFAGGSAPVCGP